MNKHITEFAAKVASTNPEVAYDLMRIVEEHGARTAADHVTTDSDRLAEILEKHWNSVENDEETGKGHVIAGGLGKVTWSPSSNDEGVWVVMPSWKFKTSAKEAARAIAAVAKIVHGL
jgi:hypothetical protein